MRIFIVRHGATADTEAGLLGGALDHALSPAGQEQARCIGRALASIPFAAVHVSDAVRCQQTARAIVDGRRLTVATEPRLRELDFGALDGLTWLQARERFPRHAQALHANPARFTPPDGETMASLRVRIGAFLDELSGAGPVLLVTHAGPTKVILLESLGMNVRHAARLWIDPASISVIDRDDQGTVVRCVNERPGPGASPDSIRW